MPTAALWLMPPRPDHPFAKSLDKLISDTVPSNFPSAKCPHFLGHTTVSSNFDASDTYETAEKAQSWLDSLDLPDEVKDEKDETVVEYMELEAGDPFFQKLTLRARQDDNLLAFVAKLHSQVHKQGDEAAQKWAKDEYAPHLSLLYSDASKQDIEQKMHKVELQLGFEIGDL